MARRAAMREMKYWSYERLLYLAPRDRYGESLRKTMNTTAVSIADAALLPQFNTLEKDDGKHFFVLRNYFEWKQEVRRIELMRSFANFIKSSSNTFSCRAQDDGRSLSRPHSNGCFDT